MGVRVPFRAFQQPLLLYFHAEFIDFFRRDDGIIAGVTGQTETFFRQTGGSNHAVNGQVVQ
jgi:hypothetical protein